MDGKKLGIKKLFSDCAILDALPGAVFLKKPNNNQQLSYYYHVNELSTHLMGFRQQTDMVGITDTQLNCQAAVGAHEFYKYDKKILTGQNAEFLNCFSYADNKTNCMLVTKKVFQEPKTKQNFVLCHGQPLNNSIRKHIDELSSNITVIHPNNCFQLNSEYQLEERTLTKRESECYFLFLRGYSAKEIANIVKLSHKTVEFHMSNIKQKIGATRRSELFDYAYQNKLLSIIPNGIFKDLIC